MNVKTQYAIALCVRSGNLIEEHSLRNAYYACDADTLSKWLKAGCRVTCPADDALIDRVRAKMGSA